LSNSHARWKENWITGLNYEAILIITVAGDIFRCYTQKKDG